MRAQLGFLRGEPGTPQHEPIASMSLWTMDFPTQFALVGSEVSVRKAGSIAETTPPFPKAEESQRLRA